MFVCSLCILSLFHGSISTGSATEYKIHQNNDNVSKESHLIYGFSEYSDGWVTTGAVVYVISNYSTIITVAYSPGNWRVDCSDEETSWPVGTEFTVYIKGCCGHTGWFGKKQGVLPESDIDMGTIMVYPNRVPNPPMIIDFPQAIQIDNNGEFIVKGTDPDDLHKVKYRFDWDAEGTHEKSNFTEYVENGESAMKKHSWSIPGTYVVKAQTTDEFGLCSNWSEGVEITVYVSNLAPSAPIITGPEIFQKNTIQSFNISSIDPENETLYYQIRWGDNQVTDWIGPFESGITQTRSHRWQVAGFYNITARAKDNLGIVSNWSQPKQIQVTEPQLVIQNISIGIGKISFDILNSGTGNAVDVWWNVTINGQRVIIGEETTGYLIEIPAFDERSMSSNFIFGFGRITVHFTATAKNHPLVEHSMDADLFAFFILT